MNGLFGYILVNGIPKQQAADYQNINIIKIYECVRICNIKCSEMIQLRIVDQLIKD